MKKYRDLIEKLSLLHITSFKHFEEINDFINNLDYTDKTLLKNFDIQKSIKDKIIFIVFSDHEYSYLKMYLTGLNYTQIGKIENCTKQNIYSIVQNKIKKLQKIVDASNNESFNVKNFLFNKE